MRITKLELYGVPIDNTYKNVFDGWASSNESTYVCMRNYATKLGIYPSQEKYSGDIKSVKISDGIAKITVRGNYFDVKQYNYALVYEGNERVTAFFVTNCVSENDGENSASTLTLEYDVWANNYPLINANSGGNTLCTVKEGHIDRFATAVYNGALRFSKIDLPIPRISPSMTKKPRLPFAPTLETDYGTISNATIPIPVWYVFAMDEEINVTGEGRVVTFDEAFYYVFFPAFAITATNVKPLLVSTKSTNASTSHILGTVTDGQHIWNIKDILTSAGATHTYYCGLTASPPFNYSVKYIEGRPTSEYPYSFWISVDEPANIVNIGNTAVTNIPVLFKQYTSEYTELYQSKDYITDEIAIRYNLDKSIPINKVKQNSFDCEIPYNYYPYKYQSANFGDKEINLVMPTTSTRWEVYAKNTGFGTECRVRRFNFDNEETYEFFGVNRNFGVPLSVDKLSEFFRDNGARFLVSNISKGASLFAGIAKKNVGAAISGTGGLLNNVATVSDLSEQRDTFLIPSQFDNLSTRILDTLYVYDNECIEDENLTADLFVTHANGYIINQRMNFLIQHRAFFEYKRSDDVRFTYIRNINERRKLEEIFSNGVRFWHINNFNKTTNNLYRVKNLDTEVLNAEIWLLSGNYISWED